MHESVANHRWLTWGRYPAYGLIFLSILSVPLALNLSIDNRFELFLNRKGTLAAEYQRFCGVFGSDQYMVIAYQGRDLFDEDSLDAQLDALERCEKAPLVERVFGIPQVYRDLFGAEDAEALRKEVLATPFYDNFLISEDDTVAGLIVDIESFGTEEEERKLMDALSEVVAPLKDFGFTVYVAGAPAFHMAMKKVAKEEALRTFPIAFVLSTVMLVFLFRSGRATLVALLCVGISILLTFAIMGIYRIPLNAVTAGGLPMFLWVLGLANLIHIIRRYQDLLPQAASVDSAVCQALSDTVRPCAVAVFTTAEGFLSLLTAGPTPVKELGLFTAIGLAISLILSLTVGPLLIRWLKVPTRHVEVTGVRWWAKRLSLLTTSRGPLLLAISLMVLIASLFCASRIRLEANLMTMLPEESELVQTYRFVNQRLIGIYNLEAAVDLPSGWLNSENWPALEEMAQSVRSLPGVSRVMSPLDILKKLNQWNAKADPSFYRLPDSSEAAHEIMDLMGEEGREEIARCVSPEGDKVRLSIFVREMEGSRFMPIAEGVSRAVANLPSPLSGYVSGIALQIIEIETSLITMQAKSFGLAFLSVFVCIIVGLRSVRLASVSFVSNLMPIVCIFGLMGLVGITLNPVTVMVASVSLGIGVEDAIHILDAYKKQRQAGVEAPDAVTIALSKVGPAITMTTVTAAIGFFALARSYLVPIRFFGILSGVAMITALLCNFLLVPSILTLRSRGKAKDRLSQVAGSQSP